MAEAVREGHCIPRRDSKFASLEVDWALKRTEPLFGSLPDRIRPGMSQWVYYVKGHHIGSDIGHRSVDIPGANGDFAISYQLTNLRFISCLAIGNSCRHIFPLLVAANRITPSNKPPCTATAQLCARPDWPPPWLTSPAPPAWECASGNQRRARASSLQFRHRPSMRRREFCHRALRRGRVLC